MNKAKKIYTSLGTMMKAKAKNPNDEKEPARFYIKLEQKKDKNKKTYGEQIFPITLANGKQLNDGDILAMFSKKESFQRAVDANQMTQAKADELSSFLKFDIVFVESVDDGNGSGNDGGGVDL